jgi:pimeloyl-ACP methyl ester carboxylesterase
MGPLPDRTHLPALDVKVVAETKTEGVVRRTISFVAEKTDHEERVPAFLILPEKQPAVRMPAILALHQTSSLGKREITGEGRFAYGSELARRGYVVLCPDYPSFGDYPCDFKDPRYASGTMKGIFNHMRGVDLLASLPQVDPQRIGVIGHSLGGHNAMFVAAFDERIKAIVSSCGWTPFGDYYGGHIEGWTSPRYMPRLRDVYRLDPKAVPFDFYEVVAALAPRPFFSNSPLHDGNFSVGGVRRAVAEAQKVYDLLHAGDRLRVVYPDCAHDFPPEVREDAYRFLDAILKP